MCRNVWYVTCLVIFARFSACDQGIETGVFTHNPMSEIAIIAIIHQPPGNFRVVRHYWSDRFGEHWPVTGARRMPMMVVVPSFPKGQEGDTRATSGTEGGIEPVHDPRFSPKIMFTRCCSIELFAKR